MKLSRSTGYALSSIFQLAELEPGGRLSTRQLAEAGGMPLRFLLQVLCELAKAQILRSHRGIDGGFSLHQPLQELTLLQVIEAIKGPMCTELPEICGIHPQIQQALHDVMDDVTQQTAEILRGTSLASLRTGHEAESGSGEPSHAVEQKEGLLRTGLMALGSSEIWLAAPLKDAGSPRQ